MFRPERWLEAAGDTLQKMERSQELIFGSGGMGVWESRSLSWSSIRFMFRSVGLSVS